MNQYFDKCEHVILKYLKHIWRLLLFLAPLFSLCGGCALMVINASPTLPTLPTKHVVNFDVDDAQNFIKALNVTDKSVHSNSLFVIFECCNPVHRHLFQILINGHLISIGKTFLMHLYQIKSLSGIVLRCFMKR